MTDSSPRMQWPFPSENQDPFWETFLAMIRAQDASAFAAREDRNLILMGGGLVSWDAGTNTLTWAATIDLLSPNTGFLNQVQAGSLIIADGQVVRGNAARAIGANAAMALSAAGFALPTDNSIIFAIRRGTRLYWRNGILLEDGDSITNLGSGQGGGSPDAIVHGDFAGTDLGRMVRTGVGPPTYAVIKDNLVATTDPTAADNVAAGYQAGSIWVNTSFVPEPRVFIAAGEDAGAMTWREVEIHRGTLYRLLPNFQLQVGAWRQYIVQGGITVDAGASFTVDPDGQLVVI